MRESLYLFESVINSRWFLRTSVILFLNKIDVFKRKLPKVRFECCFFFLVSVCVSLCLRCPTAFVGEGLGGKDGAEKERGG
jgi:hypothetical protein